nr:hypothetical protein Iba_chr08eCG8110 [Ipomoea batatas]
MASSTRKAGPRRGSSWKAKCTRPRLNPNRVPITRAPNGPWAVARLLRPNVRADRSFETAVLGRGGGTARSSSSGSFHSRISSRSLSSSSSFLIFEWKYLLEKEKDSPGFLAMIVFILSLFRAISAHPSLHFPRDVYRGYAEKADNANIHGRLRLVMTCVKQQRHDLQGPPCHQGSSCRSFRVSDPTTRSYFALMYINFAVRPDPSGLHFLQGQNSSAHFDRGDGVKDPQSSGPHSLLAANPAFSARYSDARQAALLEASASFCLFLFLSFSACIPRRTSQRIRDQPGRHFPDQNARWGMAQRRPGRPGRGAGLPEGEMHAPRRNPQQVPTLGVPNGPCRFAPALSRT